MPRMLVMAERDVLQSARTNYLNAMTARREGAAAVGANFWAFEKSDATGCFLEFVEAGNPDALYAAIAAVSAHGVQFPQMAPVWREVGDA